MHPLDNVHPHVCSVANMCDDEYAEKETRAVRAEQLDRIQNPPDAEQHP